MHLPDYKVAGERKDTLINYIELEEDYKNEFVGKKYFLRTYGCQMNVHDSEEIIDYLETLGYERTDHIELSNLVVLNTCAIRENAKDKVIGFLGKCKYLKKGNKDFIVALTGCMAQQPDFVDEVVTKYQYVDIVVGTHNIHDLPKKILEYNGKQEIDVYSNSNEVIENIKYKRDSSISAWVNISYGCDKFCTYCIVPYTRGRERSRRLESIIKEVNDLKKQGYKEVTLLGQNVNAYGIDINETFGHLLECVAKTGIERVRFVTSHPWNFTDEMINIIASYDNIMPYIHLPIQSGSTKILKKMNRRYSKEEYVFLFNKIKEKIPGVCITTDIIVGFPDEDEDDFKNTIDVVNECQFDGAYTFIYSKRDGTPAARMKDSTPYEDKEKRLYELNDLINYYSNKSNQLLLNKIVKVLVLGISEKDSSKVYGYTETMKLVNIENGINEIGNIINVKIMQAKSFSLDGIMV